MTSREKLRVREPELCGTGSDTRALEGIMPLRTS